MYSSRNHPCVFAEIFRDRKLRQNCGYGNGVRHKSLKNHLTEFHGKTVVSGSGSSCSWKSKGNGESMKLCVTAPVKGQPFSEKKDNYWATTKSR
ncbi:hypothetical protein V6N11_050831 [Hibiscus sabdariffa]|uniref:Uncharacterized protein n=1 Tax=Hibiscus sabdariffa TaxID=183260 RepID=A0ABR2TBU5_9ROSI